MKIYGLVGTSGTGKSYRAQGLASERGIPCILDDGLLIMGTKVLAGTSAKRESTRLSAIRRALLMDSDHAAHIMEAIRDVKPTAILILGTSISMIQRIADRLELSPIEELIRIEEIATEREIRLAKTQRREEGKHVIPVPTFEISKDFSGYFIDRLKIFRLMGKGKQFETLEKTVVRPTFSYFGRFYIADSAIEAIASYNTQTIEGVQRALKCSIISKIDGVSINIDVSVYYGYKINKILEQIQRKVKDDIAYVTGLNVLAINTTAKRLVIKVEV